MQLPALVPFRIGAMSSLLLIAFFFAHHPRSSLKCNKATACSNPHLQVMCTLVLACNTSSSAAILPAAPNRNRRGLKAEWFKAHEALKAEAQTKGATIRTLFLGDSITEAYRGTDMGLPDEMNRPVAAVFSRHFGSTAAAFGIGADETQHLLWRLQHGEVDGLRPKAAVVLIGTNNFGLGHMEAWDTLLGISAVAETLLARLPRTHIVMMAILPRLKESNFEPQVTFVNFHSHQMARNHHNRRLHHLDCGHVFLLQNGSIHQELMPDFLHPSALGTELMLATCIEPFLLTLPH